MDIHTERYRSLGIDLAAGLAFIAVLSAQPAGARSVVTTYQYNADGALTAATTQTDNQPATTTYLSWDNFTPNAVTPSTGTVHRANGNLLGFGASPGNAGSNTQFAYDVRDRLIGCMAAGEPPVSYAYHPASLMASSTLSSGDSLQFYYAIGAVSHVTNQRQPSSGLVTSVLGPMRYLSDGSEQALLMPRKDTAAVYQPTAQTVAPYSYEPYGAPRSAPPPHAGLSPDAMSYDLAQNPFQYAGEYQAPACSGAYYLRARWYVPELQTFLSRDPADPAHHYSYTGGNPVNRGDPNGMSYRGYQKFVGRFMKKLGVGGTVLSALPYVGPVLFLLQASATGEFWHSKGTIEAFAFMALSAGVSGLLELPAVDQRLGYRAAFGLRLGAEGATGTTQSLQAGFGGKRGRFDQAAFWENMGATTASILTGRVVAGVGYRPFNLSAADVDAMMQSHLANGGEQEILVFRARSSVSRTGRRLGSPLAEWRKVGWYHEAIVGVTKDNLFGSEIRSLEFTNQNGASVWGLARSTFADPDVAVLGDTFQERLESIGRESLKDFAYVGKFKTGDALRALDTPARGIPTAERQEVYARNHSGPLSTKYNMLSNNCQDYAAAILGALGQ